MGELFTGGVSRALGLALVQFLWQGAAISLAIAALFALMRRASSQARYLTGCVGLVAMLVAPVVTFTLSLSASRTSPPSVTMASVLAPVANLAGSPSLVQPDRSARAESAGFSTWLPAVTTVWSAGVLVLTLRLLGGWLTVRRFRNTASLAVPVVWMTKTAAIARSLGITRLVTIATSPVADVPTVVGWIRPAILVPASAVAGLSPFQFEAILAHELAHIRRHDYLVNVMQSVAETLLFYHPGVWWLSSRVRAEREECCDEMAVAYCGDRVAYAGALASLEHLRLTAPLMAVAANSGDLLTRIQRVLGVQANEERSPAVAVAIITLALLLGPLVGTVTQGALAAALPAEPTSERPAVGQDSDAVQAPSLGLASVVQLRVATPPTEPPTLVVTQEPRTSLRPGTEDAREALAQVNKRYLEATLAGQGANLASLGTLAARLAILASSEPAPPQQTVAALEERLRIARVNKDEVALSSLLDAEFTGTDPAGATLNRTQALEAFKTSPVRSITIELLSGSMLEKTAFTSGSQTIIPGLGPSRVQFTRVWTNSPTGWKLLRSVEFFAGPPVPVTIPAGTPLRVGGDIREPRLLTPNIKPVYPAAAKAAGLQGLVIIEATIDPQGNVSTARVIKSAAAELDQAAMDAVRQWKYEPTLLAGVPVSVLLNVTVNYALQ